MRPILLTTTATILSALFVFAVAHFVHPLISLFILGLLLGMVLYLSRFGFASTYRKLLLHGDREGIRAQLVMLMVATCLFAPALATGSIAGNAVAGAIAPFGWQVACGALMFGLGMQLGGGCGSGTLYTLGGGSLRMAITLAAFVVGSFWASLHMDWWLALPTLGWWSLGERLGWVQATVLQAALLGALFRLLAPYPASAATAAKPQSSFSSWTMMQGAIALAILNFATLAIAGHPWTITWAFTLWGAKLAVLAGWQATEHSFWQSPFQQAALNDSVFSDVTSLMDFGIVLGAFIAAMVSGRLVVTWRAPVGAVAASLLGGLAMGYGARIAYGCNIGAFFSGIASTSLHGWLWIVAALAGSWIGICLRPKFGLVN